MAYREHRPENPGRTTAQYSRLRLRRRLVPGLAVLAASILFSGCGEPGSPQPPSLNLPVLVRNLSAQRSGDTVHLTWTSTDRTTDHTKVAGLVMTRICRTEGVSASAPGPGTMAAGNTTTNASPRACQVVAEQKDKLGEASSYDDVLPATLAASTPRLLTYSVELVNHAQKSAGLSNAAYSAAGADLPPLVGLTAALRSEGVLLRWEPAPNTGCVSCKIRIERHLDSAQPSGPKSASISALGPERQASRRSNPLAVSAPSPNQTLELSDRPSTEALDRTALFGQTYSYRVRRVESVSLDGHTIEMLGRQSDSISIATKDTFPPAIPQDLAAAGDDREQAIDLSWSPDTEPDVAGYIIYRHVIHTGGVTSELLQRISGPDPLPTPAFHDTHVQAGMTYAYSVSAVDQAGNESARSAEAQETLTPSQ